MAGTVVDQFVVKYTLDTSGIAKGAKDVEEKLAALRAKAASSGQGFGAAVEAGAKRATGALGMVGSLLGRGGAIGLALGSLAFLGKKLDDSLFKVAQSVRQLGIDSRSFDISASGLRNVQNASEMAGGSLEDATQAVGGLRQSLFNLKFNGQISESLVMLSRLGVQFQDSYGRARDFNDVMLDTADALEKAQKSGRMTSGEAFQAAQQAGFTGGMAQLAIGGRANLAAELVKQQGRRQVSTEDVRKDTSWVRASTDLGQSILSEDKMRATSAVAETRASADEKLIKANQYVVDGFVKLGDVLHKIVTPSGGSARGSTRGGFTGGGSIGHITRGLRNNNPGNLRAVGNQPHDAEGFRVFDTMNEGIQANNAQLNRYAARGIDTPEGIVSTWAPKNENKTEEYIQDVLKRTGFRRGQHLTAADRSNMLAAMFQHESGSGSPSKSAISTQISSAQEASPSPAAHSVVNNHTAVQIDKITVNTAATDANGIAGSIGAATRRKLLMAHAERGVQ